jgi:hypothetical protein
MKKSQQDLAQRTHRLGTEVAVAIGGMGNDIFIGGGLSSVFVRGVILVAANDLVVFEMRRVG